MHAQEEDTRVAREAAAAAAAEHAAVLSAERRDRATEKEALVRPRPVLVGKNEVSFGDERIF